MTQGKDGNKKPGIRGISGLELHLFIYNGYAYSEEARRDSTIPQECFGFVKGLSNKLFGQHANLNFNAL